MFLPEVVDTPSICPTQATKPGPTICLLHHTGPGTGSGLRLLLLLFLLVAVSLMFLAFLMIDYEAQTLLFVSGFGHKMSAKYNKYKQNCKHKHRHDV